MDHGKIIHKLRKSAGKSTQVLADQAEISKKHLWEIESRDVGGRFDVVQRIFSSLGYRLALIRNDDGEVFDLDASKFQ